MLITQYAAGKQAGVTKQAINKLLNKIPRPLYFVNIMVDGKEVVRVDDDHQLWKLYCTGVTARKNKIGAEQKRFNDLLRAVIDVIQERFNPKPNEMTEILQSISDKSGLS